MTYGRLVISECHIHFDTENISKTVRLRCHICGWDFYDKSTKNRHLKTVHSQSRDDMQKMEVLLSQMKRKWGAAKIEDSDTKLNRGGAMSSKNPSKARLNQAKRKKTNEPLDIVTTPAIITISFDPIRPHLCSLPADILMQILARVRARSLLRLSTTCRTLAHTVCASDLWRQLFLAHCESSAAAVKLSVLCIPTSVWRGLYRAMFLAHVSERRSRRTDAPRRRRSETPLASTPAKPMPWRCPAGRCCASFRNQERLLSHVVRHFRAASN